jgi:hypothetical protein
MATTKFAVRWQDGKVERLKLQRSEKKGTVPFTLVERWNNRNSVRFNVPE